MTYVPDDLIQTWVVLHRGDVEVASWHLEQRGRLDLAVVDELARLQRVACRLGFTVRLRDPSAPLTELLDLAGLAGVLHLGRRTAGSAVEVGRQPEGGEEGGVEEVVVPDDPVS